MKHLPRFFSLPLAAACLLAAAGTRLGAAEHPKIDPKQGWVSLFNGRDLDGWKITDVRGGIEPNAWVVEDGCLTRKAKGYLVSNGQYGDFIFDAEFKVGPKTNSGIFLRYDPSYAGTGKIYWWNGLLEVQLFDSFGKAQTDTHDCGALYDMIAPKPNSMRPPGQWNRITITAKGSRIAIMLNGATVVEANLDDWTEAGKNPDGTPNKYHKPLKDVPRRGHLVLQDHPGEIHFRNLHLKALN
ncbi:MAG: DUF1080 domain-containing protein [Opitutus sp.]|nr:DUF1080 domain-containing protein [Opitutus sp.]